ncbi:hypothetical protein IKF43_02595 [Candidatus Saccharibacteria bacterium]|nr:hypothetical protein [Candidatus Saccharibacteria bacterium]
MLSKKIKIILVACLVLFASLVSPVFSSKTAYADDEDDADKPSAVNYESIDEQDKEGNTDEIEKTCRDNSRMGWLTCTILLTLTEIPGQLFGLVDDFLQIKPTEVFVTTSSGSNVSYEIWNQFRNIANIIIVVILLIVIFSQITGVGIDNYGIKKLLPKLIAMAIFINLSYIICQLAVDFSNIVGSSLAQIFSTWSSDIFKNQIADDIRTINIVLIIITIIKNTNPMALGPLSVIIILLLLATVVCIGIIWISLGLRNMLVIVFTVVSPVAFALYILPNTQSIFKNWWKVFQACLLIFPICGALYGASLLIQALTFTSDDISFGAALFALVAPVIPFLFIPKLLKAAIAGLGALGATIQSVTSAPKRAASAGVRAAKKTDTYKDFRSNVNRKMQEGRANAAISRLESKESKGKLSESGRRKLARMYETKDQFRREDNAARTILAEQKYAGKSQKEMQDLWRAAYNGNTSDLAALTNVMNSNWGSGAAKFMATTIGESDVASSATLQGSLRTLRNTMRENSGFATNMAKSSDAFDMISNGGLDKNGNAQNLQYFTQNQQIATSNKDIASQHTAAIKRLADEGRITPQMAEEIINDEKIWPTLDDDKRIVFKAIAQKTGANAEFKFKQDNDQGDIFKGLAKDYDEALRQKSQEAQKAAENAQRSMQYSQQQFQDSIEGTLEGINQALRQRPTSTNGGIQIGTTGELNQEIERHRNNPPRNQ